MFIFSPAAYVHILTCNLVHILTCNLIHILTCSLCSLSQCQMVPTTSQVQTCHINNKIISLLLSQWPGVQTLSTNRTCEQQMLQFHAEGAHQILSCANFNVLYFIHFLLAYSFLLHLLIAFSLINSTGFYSTLHFYFL